MNPDLFFGCPVCEELYSSLERAFHCCPRPMIRIVFICAKCGKTYKENEQREAENCCLDE